MERAAGLVFHQHKIVLDDGLQVIPAPALVKATRSLTLCIPQAELDQASRNAEEPFALSRGEFVDLCTRFESTCIDLAKLRDDLEVINKHGSGMICRNDLRGILRAAGSGLEDESFDEFFDMTDASQELAEFASIDDVLSILDPFRLSRLLDALEVDETSGRNFKSLRSEAMERQLILDQAERELAEVPTREKQNAEKRRKDEERRLAMPPVPHSAPLVKDKDKSPQPAATAAAATKGAPGKNEKPVPVLTAPPKQEKAKSGCC